MVCCGADESAERIDYALTQARTALNQGEIQLAVELCNSLTSSEDTMAMTWRDYCLAADIYATAYDNDCETEASMAAATRCLAKARRLNADSVAMFINESSHMNSGALNTVIQALDGLNTDRSTFGDHEESDNVEHEHNHDETQP